MNYFWAYHELMLFLLICGDVIQASKECRKVNLRGGHVRYSSRMRAAKFSCDPGLQLLGKAMTVCFNGNWNDPVPMCLGKSCPRLSPENGTTAETVLDGMATQFFCPGGFILDGPEVTYCHGKHWDLEPPKCLAGTSDSCNFESGLCGWVNDYSDDLNWIRHKGETPTKWTGPEADHTLNNNNGYYIFTESTVVQNSGKKARFLSPYFLPDASDQCLEFFYHMYGENASDSVGKLEVLVRSLGSEINSSRPLFAKSGDKGNIWNRAYLPIPKQEKDFQIIFRVTLSGGWLSDIALDDIQMSNCSETLTLATTELTKSIPMDPFTQTAKIDLIEVESNKTVSSKLVTDALASTSVSADSTTPVPETATTSSHTTAAYTSPARNALEYVKIFYTWALNPIIAGVALAVVVSAVVLATVKYRLSNKETRQPKGADPQKPSPILGAEEGPSDAITGKGGPSDVITGKGGPSDVITGKGGPSDVITGKGGPSDVDLGKGGPSDVITGKGV